MINKEIKEELNKYRIPYEEGVMYLLAIYYGLNNPFPSYMSVDLYPKVLATGIVVINPDKSLTWKMPLFENQETKFAWVADYRLAFKRINPDRAGNLNTCIQRMKKFFIENPSVREEDIKGAVNMYFNSVKDPQYLITSHKFIYDGIGLTRNSHLEEWVEKWQEATKISLTSESKIMQ